MAEAKDTKSKSKMKIRYENKHKAQEHQFQVGEEVLVRINTDVFQKSKPKCELDQYKIVRKKGTMITASNGQANSDKECFILQTMDPRA